MHSFLWLMLILFLFWFFVNQKCRYPKNSVSIPVLYHHWNSRTFTKLNFLSEYRILTSHSNSLVVLEFKSTTLFNCIRKVYILLQVLKWNKLFSKSTHCLSKHFLVNETMILQRMTHLITQLLMRLIKDSSIIMYIFNRIIKEIRNSIFSSYKIKQLPDAMVMDRTMTYWFSLNHSLTYPKSRDDFASKNGWICIFKAKTFFLKCHPCFWRSDWMWQWQWQCWCWHNSVVSGDDGHCHCHCHGGASNRFSVLGCDIKIKIIEKNNFLKKFYFNLYIHLLL